MMQKFPPECPAFEVVGVRYGSAYICCGSIVVGEDTDATGAYLYCSDICVGAGWPFRASELRPLTESARVMWEWMR